MAADLLENFQYGLSSSGLSGADKTVLLLKLTDPSLKCIEQYQKLKYSTSKRPSIQFKGNSGVITFPSTEAKDGEREFKFTVQPLQQTSSFESIQHYRNSRGEHKLDSLGSIQTKVTVSGTDDVYQTTQKKMKLADEEMKKVSTKEVKQNQFVAGRRVKRKSISAHAKKIISSSSTSNPSVSSNSTSYSSTLSSFNASMMTTTTTQSSSSSRNSNSTSTAASSKSAISGSRSSGAKTSGASSKGSGSAPSTQKSAVHNRSYRDRVIHLLALRAYKKPELLLRLQKDGIPSKEKNQLGTVLPQVATLARDNSYVLNKNLYNEVTLDWPAYTDIDKQLLKRKKAESGIKDSPSPPSQPSPHHASTNSSLTATGSPSTHATSKTNATAKAIPSSKAIPTSHHRKTPDAGPKSSTKRPLLPEVKDYKTMTKKPRIAHGSASMGAGPKYVDQQPQLSPSSALSISKKVPSPSGLFKKVPSPSSTTNAPPSTTTTISNSPSSNHAQQSALSSPSVSTTRNSPDCCDSTGNGTNSSITAAPAVVSGGVTKSSSSSGSRDHTGASGRSEKSSKASTGTKSIKEEKRPVGKESPSGDVSSTSVVPEYLMKYRNITSLEQRLKYKEEFNNLYPQYREHHKFIEGIKQKFKGLKDELYHTKKDSEAYDYLQDKVIEEYNKITQDPAYKTKERRWKELHHLLGHIKALIMVYDNEPMQTDNS